MRYVRKRHPHLRTPWGVYSAISVNSGGKVSTRKHTDCKNYAAGMCAIVANGDFDFTQSAFLFVELGDVIYRIELPPGIPVFIPSALVTHWNSRIIGPREYRGSLVYWMSGALVRYMELEGRKVSDLERQERSNYENGRAARVKEGMDLFPRN